MLQRTSELEKPKRATLGHKRSKWKPGFTATSQISHVGNSTLVVRWIAGEDGTGTSKGLKMNQNCLRLFSKHVDILNAIY